MPDDPGREAYILALTLLSARELSEAQLRTRLRRRQVAPENIDAALSRLKADRTLDDRRVALAIARTESSLRGRGRSRVIQKIRQAGIDSETADAAVREVFEDVDENELLDQAFLRRLRNKAVTDLDDKCRARMVRGLVAQGFSIDAVLKKLR